MGLTVRAFCNIDLVKATTEYDTLCESKDHYRLFNVEAFRDRFDGLAEGYYRVRYAPNIEPLSFTYSGYGVWRKHLCKMVCWSKIRHVWRGRVKPPAFGELICFSDCEGVIGPRTCTKLAADFAKWRDRAGEYVAVALERSREIEPKTFRRYYDDFATMCSIAAPHGAVRFS